MPNVRPAPLLGLLVTTLAFVLPACGGGGGAEACFYDAFGTYVCVGSDGGAYPYKTGETIGVSCDRLAWSGSVNEVGVLDANGNVVSFEATAPHVLRAGDVRIADVHVSLDGTLRWQGAVVGRVALVPGAGDAPVAALVDLQDRLLDLRAQEGGLWITVTRAETRTTASEAVPCTSTEATPAVTHLDDDVGRAPDDLSLAFEEVGLVGVVDLSRR